MHLFPAERGRIFQQPLSAVNSPCELLLSKARVIDEIKKLGALFIVKENIGFEFLKTPVALFMPNDPQTTRTIRCLFKFHFDLRTLYGWC